MMDGGGMGLFGGLGMLGGWLAMLFYIAVIVGFVVLVLWVIQRATGGGNNRSSLPSGPSPREILQARYARGEITREQYQQMLQDLS